MQNIDELRKRLKELPQGYISEKIISNKKYYYLKYYENGKQISRYIKSDTVKYVRKQINERKEIESFLDEYEKSLKNMPILSDRAKNLTGSIMSGDIKVATYEKGRLIYKNEELCPLIIKRTNNVSAFLKGRVIDSSRTNFRLLKKVLNINTNNDEHISLYAYGSVITDNYWFKPKGSRLKYKDICFNSDYYSDLALKGEIAVYPKTPKYSPQITAIGSFEKCWKKINKEWWLYKKGTKEQLFSEIFCSILAKKMNIPTVVYEYDDGFVRSKNFADKYNFDPMTGLVGDNEDYSFIFDALLNIDEKIANQYLMLSFFDCLVNNIDRHNENIGLLRDRKTGNILSLAPNFDNNLSLLGFDTKLSIDSHNDGFIKQFVNFLKKNNIAQKRFSKLKIAKLNKKIIYECIDLTPIKLNQYDICTYIMNRYDYLISIKNNFSF